MRRSASYRKCLLSRPVSSVHLCVVHVLDSSLALLTVTFRNPMGFEPGCTEFLSLCHVRASMWVSPVKQACSVTVRQTNTGPRSWRGRCVSVAPGSAWPPPWECHVLLCLSLRVVTVPAPDGKRGFLKTAAAPRWGVSRTPPGSACGGADPSRGPPAREAAPAGPARTLLLVWRDPEAHPEHRGPRRCSWSCSARVPAF